MKISDSYKESIYNGFIHTSFRDRTAETIKATLNAKVRGSGNVTLVPKVDELKVAKVNDITDKVTFIYEDFKFSLDFHWRKSSLGFVLIGIE